MNGQITSAAVGLTVPRMERRLTFFELAGTDTPDESVMNETIADWERDGWQLTQTSFAIMPPSDDTYAAFYVLCTFQREKQS